MHTEDKQVSSREKALASRILESVQRDEEHWKDSFEQMRKDVEYASGKQWGGMADGDSDMTVVNLIQRHVQQSTASIYAKNPRVVAKPRRTLDYKLWDGSAETLTLAMQQVVQSTAIGEQPSPDAIAIVEDAESGNQMKRMRAKIGKTLETLYHYELDNQEFDYKQSMKQLVRRAKTTGVGYAKWGYTVPGDLTADTIEGVGDIQQQLAKLEQLIDITESKGHDTSDLEADAYELELTMQGVASRPRHVHEGLVLSFPESDSIIPDVHCTALQGFEGCQRVSQKYALAPEQVKAIYGRDVCDDVARAYDAEQSEIDTIDVYEVWDKTTGLVYDVAEGVEGFLRTPAAPDVKIDTFWPWEALLFNVLPDDERVFPPSDVSLLKDIQDEYNRTRQAFREHRWANRPGYFLKKGAINDNDIARIGARRANDVIQVNLTDNGRVQDVLEKLQTTGLDPNQYSTDHLMADIQRVTGSTEPSFGGVSGGTATESSINEGSRMSGVSSNVDDLDDFLSRKAQKGAQILFAKAPAERVKQIVGAGAAWPEIQERKDEIAAEIMLSVRAGSSGRPNRVAELQNFERLAPTLTMLPGVDPVWFAKEAIKRMDDGLDLEEAIVEGMPSVVAMNQMQQVSTGDPATSPEMQGDQGGANAQTVEEPDAVPTPAPPQLN